MTREEKDLVLRDLCARLPYGVIVEIKSYGQETQKPWFGELSCKDLDCFLHDVAYESIKPYLRPMSSMTEEEEQEYRSLCGMQFTDELADDNTTFYYFDTIESFDWLNKKMFDYQGLIPKGLALEAPEGMYNN